MTVRRGVETSKASWVTSFHAAATARYGLPDLLRLWALVHRVRYGLLVSVYSLGLGKSRFFPPPPLPTSRVEQPPLRGVAGGAVKVAGDGTSVRACSVYPRREARSVTISATPFKVWCTDDEGAGWGLAFWLGGRGRHATTDRRPRCRTMPSPCAGHGRRHPSHGDHHGRACRPRGAYCCSLGIPEAYRASSRASRPCCRRTPCCRHPCRRRP